MRKIKRARAKGGGRERYSERERKKEINRESAEWEIFDKKLGLRLIAPYPSP